MDLLKSVDDLDGRTAAWIDTYSAQAADAAAAAERAAMERDLTKNGILMAPPESLTAWETKWRKDRDTQAFLDGNKIDLDADILAQQVAATVAEHETLYPLARRYQGSERGLLAIVADELCTASARARFADLTRGQLAAEYATLEDGRDDHNAALRLIEDAVIGGTLGRLGLRDDPEHDALNLPRLQDAVRARRAARVPAHVRDAQARLAAGRPLRFSELLRHLRSGRGIATRPAQRALQVV